MKGLPSSPFKRKRGHSCDVTRHNRQFLDWARRDSPAAVEESAATAAAPEPYIPDNQALALLQSAYDEFIESRGIAELPFDPNDPGWITIAEEKQKAAARPKHPFISHKDAGSFRYDLPADAAVVLFADWGTGEPTAQRVMQPVAAAHTTHAIHLGDVYYAGTPQESQKRFLDVVERFGSPRDTCRYFAMAGNHDYYSGGYAGE
jgi:hypothetical protein